MYKGHKVTKHLERYMVYAKNRYDRLSVQGEIDLWDVLNGYTLISNEPYCMQLYIYDWIMGIVNGMRWCIG